PHFFRLPQIDEAVFLLKGDRTDGAECSYAAPAPFKFRCVCPACLSGLFFLFTKRNKKRKNKIND
ncbi:MAG: hypothetical protein MJK14_12520, partial [Rivularia sp. ALOHA_DT_140]|nr:hypothetical protein [Rivularia sp. ALOHA_DT_140]